MVLTVSDRAAIQETAERFFREQLPVSHFRHLRDSADPVGFSSALWKAAAELGFAGLQVSADHGGTELGLVAAGVIQEEIGKNLSPTPLLSNIMATTILSRCAAAESIQTRLANLAAGDEIIALAHEESTRHRPDHIATKTVKSGRTFSLTGQKVFVIDGAAADRFIVSARTPDDAARFGLFLVDAKSPGLTVAKIPMIDERNVAVVTLNQVAVDDSALLGEENDAHAALEYALDAARSCLAAELLGISIEAFNRTLAYMKEREQFGVKIGTFQALQHRMAALFCELQLVRSITYRALESLDMNEVAAPLYASQAKAKASDVAMKAANEAIQLHGGIGMTDELDIGFFLKRAKAASEALGGFAFHADRHAKLKGY